MFSASAEQRRTRLEQLGAELVGGDGFHRVSGAPVEQVDGGFMPFLPFGDQRCACLGLFKAANHAVDQLIGVFRIPSLRFVLNQLVDLISQGSLQLGPQLQLIGVLPAFQGALASASSVQLLKQRFFTDHDCGQSGTGGHFQIKVSEMSVVSHQAWASHRNPLRAIGRRCLCFFKRNGHGAGFGSAGSAEKEALVGFKQIEAYSAEVKAAQSASQWSAAHLQGDEIGRERPEQFLKALTAEKRAVNLGHWRTVINKTLAFLAPDRSRW